MVDTISEQDTGGARSTSRFLSALRSWAAVPPDPTRQERVNNHAYNGHKLAFRIGINSGPVVAGVIGRKKFAYDLWGDVVNTARPMESHGSSGHVQITQSTYDLINDEFICDPQGTVEVKGKGEMNIWYVLQEKEPLTSTKKPA